MKGNSEIIQYEKVYQSTTEFKKFLLKNKAINKKTKNILDMGCGYGAQINYFSKIFPNIDFTGWDYSQKAIDFANKNNPKKSNFFEVKDIYKIKKKKSFFNLIFSIHTFCVFKKINEPIKRLCSLRPDYIAINSLFYDGQLDVLIHIRDLNNKSIKDSNPDADFNIHSLQNTKLIFKTYGYKIEKIKKFFPKKKIKKSGDGRGSYTINTSFGKNSIFSGPVYLPWYFILAKKINVKK